MLKSLVLIFVCLESDLYYAVLLHILALVPLSECAPVLEYRYTEVLCSIFYIGAPVCILNYFSKRIFFSKGACTKKRYFTVPAQEEKKQERKT